MTKRIFKYPVPIDDQQHDLPLRGDVVAVAHQPGDSHNVMVWAWHDDGPMGADKQRRVRVVGTGHTVPWWADHHYGAAIDPMGLVWHLVGMSLPTPPGLPPMPDENPSEGL